METLAKRLKLARKEQELTQAQLAELSGIKQSDISKIENGSILKTTVESGRGSEHRFASEADIVNKFLFLATKALPKSQAEELCDAILNLEKLDDAKKLTMLMTL